MNERNQYYGIVLRRYFERFNDINYHGVSVGKFLYFQFYRFFIRRWSYDWAKNNLPYFQEEMDRFSEAEIHAWSDESYPYDRRPDGVILMRGGFVDIASQHLPRERYFLISHTKEEVDLIRANMPDQTAHSIDEYFRDNPAAAAKLNRQIAQVIREHADDPIFGSPELLQWFKDNLTKTVLIFDAVQTLFEQMKVSAVLTISAINWMESALNLFARANRIPSFTGQHGLIVDEAVWGHIPILATKKLVWGNGTLEWYKKHGVPESRVSVIGSPRLEIIFNQKWWDKQQLCRALGVDPSRKIIIFATQRLCFSKESVPIALEGMKSVPGVFLALLLHPGETPVFEQYQQLIKGHPNCKAVRFGHISLYDAMSGADYFMTGHSTSALEAMLFGLPVITVEPTPLIYSYADAGASLRVTNAAEFSQVLNRLNSDASFRAAAVNRYQKFLTDQCIPDGLASKRLFDEVQMICQSGGIA